MYRNRSIDSSDSIRCDVTGDDDVRDFRISDAPYTSINYFKY